MNDMFDCTAWDKRSRARCGVLHTAHGNIETPIFMPVGTQATVKALAPSDLRQLGAQCILSNTYHLWLRPGEDLIQRAGGIHAFMGWDGAILTDSGGFQIMSLARLVDITEQGATFSSHLDGEVHVLTPERAMQVQEALGSDIAMVLDVCSPPDAPRSELVEAMERTTRWAYRSLEAAHAAGQAVFAIVQGGVDVDLRHISASQLALGPFDGFAIGGLSVGESRSETWPALDAAIEGLPAAKPRYLMGVGAPDDVLEAIARGVDMFDCVLPTRLGRNGAVFHEHGRLDLRDSKLVAQNGPLMEGCDCFTCTHFEAGYISYLFRCREELGYRLASIHNLRFLIRLVARARQAIRAGAFDDFMRTALQRWHRPNENAGRLNRARFRRAHESAMDN